MPSWLQPYVPQLLAFLDTLYYVNIALAYYTNAILGLGWALAIIFQRRHAQILFGTLFTGYAIIYIADILAEQSLVYRHARYQNARLACARVMIGWAYTYLVWRILPLRRQS